MTVEVSKNEMNMIKAGLTLYMQQLISLKDDRECVRKILDEQIDQLIKLGETVNHPNISLFWKNISS